MTQQEYIAQNANGFEGDTILKEKFKSIIDKWGINCIIETGSYRGATTAHLGEMVPNGNVYSVEIKKENYDIAKERVKDLKNVSVTMASSPDYLGKILQAPMLKIKRILFFLDAHWDDYCPLLDELKLIADNNLEPVIAIHDFKVPDCPLLGFDSYKGQDYDFDWIKSSIEKIYPDGYVVEYNNEALGAKRGVIFIYPDEVNGAL